MSFPASRRCTSDSGLYFVNPSFLLIFFAIIATASTTYSKEPKCLPLKKLLAQNMSIKEVFQKWGPRCPSQDAVRIALAVKWEREGRLRDAIDVLRPVTTYSEVKKYVMASVLFKAGRLEEALKYARSLSPEAGLAGMGARLQLKILCRMNRCREGIQQVITSLYLMSPRERIKARIEIAQAYVVLGAYEKARSVMLYLLFNSVGEDLKLVRRLWTTVFKGKERWLWIREILSTDNLRQSIKKYYWRIRKDLVLRNLFLKKGKTTLPEYSWIPEYLDLKRNSEGGEKERALAFLLRHPEVPVGPGMLDKVIAKHCPEIPEDSLLRIIKTIPHDGGYYEIAALKIAGCFLWKGQPSRAKEVLSTTELIRNSGGLVFGYREQALSFLALTQAMMGNKKQAVLIWRRLIQSYPYSVASIMAWSHLHLKGEEVKPLFKEGGDCPKDIVVSLETIGEWRFISRILQAKAASGAITVQESQLLGGLLYRHLHWKARLQSVLRGRPKRSTKKLFRLAYPLGYFRLISKISGEVNIPSTLLLAMVRAESRFRPWVVSKKGAIGLMQLQRGTAKIIAYRVLKRPGLVNALFHPYNNLLLGAHYVRILLKHFKGYLPLVIIAYNAGITAAHHWQNRMKGVPTELALYFLRSYTLKYYVERILVMTAAYSRIYGLSRGFEYIDPEVSGSRTPLPIKMSP